jgi:hypothetical protein
MIQSERCLAETEILAHLLTKTKCLDAHMVAWEPCYQKKLNINVFLAIHRYKDSYFSSKSISLTTIKLLKKKQYT